MASTYTLNSGIQKPGIGDQSGEWGTTINTNMDILDRATNGVGAITLSGTTHTLTTTDGALSDGQYKVLVLGGSPSGTNTITIAPNDQDKLYFVVNDSGQTVTFTQGSGADVSILDGVTKIVYADGAGTGAAVTEFTSETPLSETIADTVGAMVTSNTETNITVTYDDSDNTLDFVIGTLNQDTTGNAATATVLETTRAINGVNFDGSAAITVTAAAGTLTGTTLKSTVTASSLTSLGTVATGTWQGTAVADTYVANDLTISGGTVNNSVIGGSTAAAGTFTALSATGNVILGDASGDSVTFNAATATIPNNLAFSGTGTVKMPVGTTAQRPTGAAGMFRYNSTTGKFEGYTAAWGSVGGGATGGGSDEVFVENSDDVTVDYTITSGKNAMSVGPITLASGVDVTIPSGSRWVIL
jgi:hypothetical protein